jgi:hypothetical protein
MYTIHRRIHIVNIDNSRQLGSLCKLQVCCRCADADTQMLQLATQSGASSRLQSFRQQVSIADSNDQAAVVLHGPAVH